MNLDSRHRPRGFSLVELLVVIIIVGILIGMLLPAVASIRESARDTQCRKHLEQIGVAALNFESAHMKFPSAGAQTLAVFDTGEEFGPKNGFENLGWAFQLLPFIEQENLQEQRFAHGYMGGDTPLLEQVVPTYGCPSRGPRISTKELINVALGDYAGVIGNWNDTNWSGLQWRHDADPSEDEFSTVWTGIIVKDAHTNIVGPKITDFPDVGLSNISDGSSNTLMFMEKAVFKDFYSFVDQDDFWEGWGYYQPGDWANSRMVGLPAADNGAEGNGNEEVPLLADDAGRPGWMFNQNGKAQSFGFGSAHTGTLNAVLGDGSVRKIDINADSALLNSLGKRADGSAANMEDVL